VGFETKLGRCLALVRSGPAQHYQELLTITGVLLFTSFSLKARRCANKRWRTICDKALLQQVIVTAWSLQ
jgi:hypothetical protein